MAVRFRLSELLKERKKDFPTQAELSRQSGVSTVTINAIATGRTEGIKLETLDRLCSTLGCQPGDLLEWIPGKRRGKGK